MKIHITVNITATLAPLSQISGYTILHTDALIYAVNTCNCNLKSLGVTLHEVLMRWTQKSLGPTLTAGCVRAAGDWGWIPQPLL